MAYEIYDMNLIDSDGYSDRLPDGWRVYRLDDGNPMDECFVDMPADMDEGEREDEMAFALRRKYGRKARLLGYEDVTELYMAGADE